MVECPFALLFGFLFLVEGGELFLVLRVGIHALFMQIINLLLPLPLLLQFSTSLTLFYHTTLPIIPLINPAIYLFLRIWHGSILIAQLAPTFPLLLSVLAGAPFSGTVGTYARVNSFIVVKAPGRFFRLSFTGGGEGDGTRIAG